MSISEGDIARILATPEIKNVLDAVAPTPPDEHLKRELWRRRAEIEFIMSFDEEKLSAANNSLKETLARIDQRTNEGAHGIRLAMCLLVIVPFALLAAGTYFLRWKIQEVQLASWNAPFDSGSRVGFTWTFVYLACVALPFEVDFFLRRRPRKRARIEFVEALALKRLQTAEAVLARESLLRGIIRHELTEILNSDKGPVFAKEIRVKPDVSLSDATDIQRITIGFELSETPTAETEVPTAARRKILQWIEDNPGGSIGISGPRGVGKSTLLASICGTNLLIKGRPTLSVKTAAPVDYASRDFLLHLFSTFCRRVLATEGVDRQIYEDSYATTESQRWQQASLDNNIRPISQFLWLISIPLLAIALSIAFLTPPPQPATTSTGAAASASPSTIPQACQQARQSNRPLIFRSIECQSASLISNLGLTAGPIATLGIVAACFAFALDNLRLFERLIFNRKIILLRRKPPADTSHEQLVQRAVVELRNIRFQRSYTTGWSGTMTMPAGLAMSSTSGLTLAQQAESLPELVERFREFAVEVASVYGRVIFGIDELDKLKTDTDAENFLNGIKSVFGIPHCYYLISVSENALSSFDRRGIGFRDAFDSAFDEVLHIDFLDLAQSRTLLNRRILRLPDPFLQLCHMLSGGLPRDLIRQARMLLEAAATEDDSPANMEEVTNKRVYHDLASKIRATSIAIRNTRETPATNDLLARVGTLPTRHPAEESEKVIGDFRKFLTYLHDSQTEDNKSIVKLGLELAAYFEMMMLIRRVASLLSTEEGWKESCRNHLAQRVAAIRQALEVGVPLAEALMQELRKKISSPELND